MNTDITFCVNDECKKKNQCHRYIKNHVITEYVSMANFDEKDCDYYIRIRSNNE